MVTSLYLWCANCAAFHRTTFAGLTEHRWKLLEFIHCSTTFRSFLTGNCLNVVLELLMRNRESGSHTYVTQRHVATSLSVAPTKLSCAKVSSVRLSRPPVLAKREIPFCRLPNIGCQCGELRAIPRCICGKGRRFVLVRRYQNGCMHGCTSLMVEAWHSAALLLPPEDGTSALV